MEFDSGIRLRDVRTVHISSDRDFDSFMRALWDVSGEESREVADTGGGEIWLDYSDFLRTRHMVVNVSASEGGYELRFRSGSKPSLFSDVVIMALCLLAFRLLGKVFVPHPPLAAAAGLVLSLAAVILALFRVGRRFGNAEVDEIIKKIENI